MFWFWGCDGAVSNTPELEVVEWYAFVESSKVDSGESIILQVDIFADKNWQIEIEKPFSQTLEVQKQAAGLQQQRGDQIHQRHRFSLRGSDGSHVIEAIQIRANRGTEEQEFQGTKIFVDIGLKGPSSGVKGIREREQEPANIWPWILGTGVLASGLGWYLYRRKKLRREHSPQQEARQKWRSIRASGASDHALAISLSEIVRGYVDTMLDAELIHQTPLEAKKWVWKASLTMETKEAMVRLLDATNLLKYAREGGGENFFDLYC